MFVLSAGDLTIYDQRSSGVLCLIDNARDATTSTVILCLHSLNTFCNDIELELLDECEILIVRIYSC
jgi:hypothetical protein